MTVPTIVLPADPREIFLSRLQPLLPAILPGWRCGWRQDQGFVQNVTPGKFISLDVLGVTQMSHVHEQFLIAAQVWGDNGITDDKMRTKAARLVFGHMQEALGARLNAWDVLPDPFDESGTRHITQVTMTVLLKGEDQ